ncbi:MAG: hypothetical protein ABSF90_31515 [Syntrophobacteraceae bacterium]
MRIPVMPFTVFHVHIIPAVHHPDLRVYHNGKVRKQQVFAVGDHLEELSMVTQAPFYNEPGFSLEVTHNMKNIPPAVGFRLH